MAQWTSGGSWRASFMCVPELWSRVAARPTTRATLQRSGTAHGAHDRTESEWAGSSVLLGILGCLGAGGGAGLLGAGGGAGTSRSQSRGRGGHDVRCRLQTWFLLSGLAFSRPPAVPMPHAPCPVPHAARVQAGPCAPVRRARCGGAPVFAHSAHSAIGGAHARTARSWFVAGSLHAGSKVGPGAADAQARTPRASGQGSVTGCRPQGAGRRIAGRIAGRRPAGRLLAGRRPGVEDLRTRALPRDRAAQSYCSRAMTPPHAPPRR